MAEAAGKLSYNVAEICGATGRGRTPVFELIGSGALPSFMCCGRRLVLAEDLRAFLSAASRRDAA